MPPAEAQQRFPPGCFGPDRPNGGRSFATGGARGGSFGPFRGGMNSIMDVRNPDLKVGAKFASVPPGRAGPALASVSSGSAAALPSSLLPGVGPARKRRSASLQLAGPPCAGAPSHPKPVPGLYFPEGKQANNSPDPAPTKEGRRSGYGAPQNPRTARRARRIVGPGNAPGGPPARLFSFMARSPRAPPTSRGRPGLPSSGPPDLPTLPK